MTVKKPSGAPEWPEWVDPDDAPELTDVFFDQAEIRRGERVVRRGPPRLSHPKAAGFPPPGPGCAGRLARHGSRMAEPAERCVARCAEARGLRLCGEPGGTRTHDHSIKSRMLYRLSYRLTEAALRCGLG